MSTIQRRREESNQQRTRARNRSSYAETELHRCTSYSDGRCYTICVLNCCSGKEYVVGCILEVLKSKLFIAGKQQKARLLIKFISSTIQHSHIDKWEDRWGSLLNASFFEGSGNCFLKRCLHKQEWGEWKSIKIPVFDYNGFDGNAFNDLGTLFQHKSLLTFYHQFT